MTIDTLPDYTIRFAREADLPRMAWLALAMERHYETDTALTEKDAERRLGAALFGDKPLVQALLGVAGGEIVALALFDEIFPAAALTTAFVVREIFVHPERRKRRYGLRLSMALARLAVARGHTRMEWSTPLTSSRASAFFRSHDIMQVEEYLYHLEGEPLHRIAEQAPEISDA